MAKIDIIRHEIRTAEVVGDEAYDPGRDMLIVFHRNPNDPDDPTEFGHHIQLHGLAIRKEMWGLAEYSDVIDTELRDLERYYDRSEAVEYGVHPLANMTDHYFTAPRKRMKSFSPAYVVNRMGSAMPVTRQGADDFCVAVALSGIEDVKDCLASASRKSFPCHGMTGLSTDTVARRSVLSDKMGEQTQQLTLVPGAPIDAVRQLLTDRAAEIEDVRSRFVDHVLLEASVPELMRVRAKEVVDPQIAGK
jgi:hypothetical protein